MNELLVREIANDCAILLQRALENKSIACFGIDGNGLFGQTDQAQTYPIKSFTIRMDSASDDDDIEARFEIELEGYDALKFGAVLTDQNFMFSLNKLLEAAEISPDIWTWDLVADQPQHSVILELDVPLLLQW